MSGDGDLGEERECHRILGGAELRDLFIRSRLLAGEVVGGEAEDGEAAVFELLIERFERGVLRGEAALAGDVDQQQDFAGVVSEGGRGAGDGGQGDVSEVGHEGSLAGVCATAQLS